MPGVELAFTGKLRRVREEDRAWGWSFLPGHRRLRRRRGTKASRRAQISEWRKARLARRWPWRSDQRCGQTPDLALLICILVN